MCSSDLNYQKWQINATTTNNNSGTDSSYWLVPVTLLASNGTGTTNFANNHDLFLGIITPQDTLAWFINGNSGTDWASNFIGTVDNESLTFKTNNDFSGALDVTNANTSFGVLSNDCRFSFGSVAVGYNAGKLFSTGDDNNVAIGLYSLDALNSGGGGNIAIGSNTMTDFTSGQDNVIIGNQAMPLMTLGSNNVGIGNDVFRDVTSTGMNTAIGSLSTVELTTGINNTALGYSSLSKVLTGNGNIGIGWSSGGTNQLGSYNTYLGYNAGGSGETRQAISLGYEAGSADNTLTLSDSTFAILPGDSNVT